MEKLKSISVESKKFSNLNAINGKEILTDSEFINEVTNAVIYNDNPVIMDKGVLHETNDEIKDYEPKIIQQQQLPTNTIRQYESPLDYLKVSSSSANNEG